MTPEQAARAARKAAKRAAKRANKKRVVTYYVPPTGPRKRKNRNRNRQPRAYTGASAAAAAGSPAVSRMSQAPVSVSRVRRQTAPSIQMAGNGEKCRIRHREYVAEVSGSTSFATTSYVMQPGLQTLFNWLAAIAGQFEKYRFLAVRFCYETENATSQGGSIMYAFDWDVLDTAPLSKQELMSMKSSVRAAPWQEFCLELDMRDAQKDWYYTRSGSVPSGADAKLYDMGNLVVASQNASGASGELYIEYDIELIVPQQNQSPISGRVVGAGTMSATQLIGTSGAYSTGSNVGWSLGSDGSTYTCTVAGDYLFQHRLVGTTLVVTSAGSAPGGTATTTEILGVANTGGTDASYTYIVRAQVGQTVAPSIDSAAAVSTSTTRIARYNYSLN